MSLGGGQDLRQAGLRVPYPRHVLQLVSSTPRVPLREGARARGAPSWLRVSVRDRDLLYLSREVQLYSS